MRKWNRGRSDQNGAYGGFADADDNFTEGKREAAETALYGGVKATEGELPFN